MDIDQENHSEQLDLGDKNSETGKYMVFSIETEIFIQCKDFYFYFSGSYGDDFIIPANDDVAKKSK